MVTPRHRHDSNVCFSQEDRDGVEREYIANFLISGSYSPANFHHDAEYPDVELCCIERDDPKNPGEVKETDYERLGINPCTVQENLTDKALENAEEPEPRERDD